MSGPDAAATAPPQPRPAARRRRGRLALLVAVALGVATKTWVVDSYAVREQSMRPRLVGGVDHVVVDKTAARRGALRRFDLVVFRKDGVAYVKRALSLGGEVLGTRAGDLFVRLADGSTERLARPESVRDAQRLSVFPSAAASGAAGVVADEGGVVRDGEDGALVFVPEGPALKAHLRTPTGEDDAGVRDDYVGADGVVRRGRAYVPDVRVVVDRLERAEGAAFEIVHRLRGEVRVVRVGPEGISLEVREDAHPPRVVPFPGTPPPTGVFVETLDGVFRLAARFAHGPWKDLLAEARDTAESAGASQLRFRCTGGVVAVRGLTVERDVHYADVDGGDAPPGKWSAPAGRLFVVGDNVPVSTDSRTFGTVAPEDVTGRVVGSWRPPAWARRP